MTADLVGVLTVAIWLYLLLGRGFFWRLHEEPAPELKRNGIPVAVVMPARDEAGVIDRAATSVLTQDYPARIDLFVVDDHSSDDTAEIARQAATAAGAGDRLEIVKAAPLPPGWTGKLWAVACGLNQALLHKPGYVLLTDADIVHAPGTVAELVARAEAFGLDLASLMVKLRCSSPAERALIPAFLFFFLKLYPPAWIADLESKTAGAAGGCILIRPSALKRIGGIESIRGELIDDCALARKVKSGGPIWMGVSTTCHSIRSYETFGEIARMISRTAFTQLRHSVLLLAGTVLGLLITYVAPPALALGGPDWLARGLGLAAWLLMMAAYFPALRLYKQSPILAPLLPVVALFYLGATVYSAFAYWSGKGGLWKGRIQDRVL